MFADQAGHRKYDDDEYAFYTEITNLARKSYFLAR
jgi:hypothetical protein